MCLNPVRIVSPRLSHRAGVDKEYIYVPCGHCDECIAHKHNDWFVRLFSEYDFYKRKGCVKFLTFTFNEYNIPTFVSSDFPNLREKFGFDFVGNMRYFDKKSFSLFIKKLRTLFKRLGYSDGIKFFAVCEYGDTTFRPHYHVIFFLPFAITDSLFQKFCEHCYGFEIDEEFIKINYPFLLKDFLCHVERCHLSNYKKFSSNIYVPYGKGNVSLFTSSIDKYNRLHHFMKVGNISYSESGGDIMHEGCIKYVVKYVSKPNGFDHSPYYALYNEFISTLPSVKNLDDDCKEELKKLSQIKPFILTSKGIGITLYNKILSDYEKAVLENNVPSFVSKICDEKIKLGSSDFDCGYRLPSYVINKLVYNIIPLDYKVSISFDGVSLSELDKNEKRFARLLTPLGKDIKKHLMFTKRSSFLDLIRKFKNIDLHSFLKPYLSPSDLIVFEGLRPAFDVCSAEDIAMYMCFFRGLAYSEKTISMSYVEYVDSYIESYNDFFVFEDSEYYALRFMKDIDIFDYHLYELELCAKFVEFCRIHFNRISYITDSKKNARLKRLRDKYNIYKR